MILMMIYLILIESFLMNKKTSKRKSRVSIYSYLTNIEGEHLRKKVRAMSKMMTLLKNLREENEGVVGIKGDGKVPKALL